MGSLREYYKLALRDGGVQFFCLRWGSRLVQLTADDERWDVNRANRSAQVCITEGSTGTDVPNRICCLYHSTDLPRYFGTLLAESCAEEACKHGILYGSHASLFHYVDACVPGRFCTNTCGGVGEHGTVGAFWILGHEIESNDPAKRESADMRSLDLESIEQREKLKPKLLDSVGFGGHGRRTM